MAKRIVDSDDDDDDLLAPAQTNASKMPSTSPNTVAPNAKATIPVASRYPAPPMTMPCVPCSMSTFSQLNCSRTPRTGQVSGNSAFVGGFAPNIQGDIPPVTAQPAQSLGSNYYPPRKTYSPPSHPPPNGASRPTTNAPSPAATATGNSIRIPQEGERHSLLHAVNKATHAVNAAAHTVIDRFHPRSPTYAEPYSHSQVEPPRPPRNGEFDLDTVQSMPGDPTDWNDLLNNIKATAEEVAEEFKEEDTIVPGFAEGITLKPWQVQGRQWMLKREQGSARGGILADDMGLGTKPTR